MALFATLAVLNTYPLARSPASTIGTHFDAMFSVWRLAWIAHQIRSDPIQLFNANIFYPEPRTLAYSDAILLPALIVAPLHWVGLEPVAVYNLTLLAAFILNALAAFVLVDRLTGSMAAGCLGGVIFAFAPFRFDHFDHLEMQFSFWIPLTVLAWHRAVERQTPRDYLKVAGLTACQILSCIYYGIFLLTWLAVISIVWFVRAPRRLLKASGWMLALPLLVMAIYSIPYMANHGTLGERSRRDAISWSAKAGDFLRAPSSNVLYGSTAVEGNAERYLLPGIVAGVLVVVACWPPWDRVRAIHVAGLVFALQLAAGFNGLVYPLLYDLLLPYRALRVPARATVLVLLGVAVLAGFGLTRVARSLEHRTLSGALAGLIIVVTSFEYFSRPSFRQVNRVSPWYSTLRSMPDAVVFEWPVTVPWRLHPLFDVSDMYNSLWHWKPLLNGYSGNHPPRDTSNSC